MSAHEITPNRSVLLDLKRRIKLSQNGHKIMKMKRDGLIIEFFNVLEKAKAMRSSVTSDYQSAMTKIAIARAVEGEIAVKSAAYALKSEPHVKVGSKSIMGMMVPKVEAEMTRTGIEDKGYGVISTSVYIEEASQAFQKLLETLVRAAEIETTMKKLLDEIEKTKRRVNGMEFKIIPDLQASQAFVKFRLEEMERENTIRLKFLKRKSSEAA
jgi:V/A-type H+-transporting ATPase subunit D